MDYEISISKSKKFIIVNYMVDLTRELGAKIAEETDAVSKKNNIHNLLNDLRNVKNFDDVKTNFDFVKEIIPEQKELQFTKIAQLLSRNEHSHASVTAFLIASGFNVREFLEEEKAIKWLEE